MITGNYNQKKVEQLKTRQLTINTNSECFWKIQLKLDNYAFMKKFLGFGAL